MSKQWLSFRAISAILITFVVTGTSPSTPQSWAALEDSPKALVDEAWQVVHREYVDRTFNRLDWQAVRQDYLKRAYASKPQAYQAIREMLGKLDDPYTEFLDAQDLKNLISNTSGDFIGVGVTVGLDPQTSEWVVISPLKGSPAATAGLQPQDVITKINGQSTPQINPQQATKYLIGPVGSQVLLTVRRGTQDLNFKLIREHIDLHPVTYRAQDTSVGKVGYIRLPVFTSKSPKLMQEALQDLEKQQVKGYLLDLRSNPGGILETSLAIARMWLNQGTVVSVMDRQGKKDRFAAARQALTQKPLVVLVDGNSASASEILAGALQDNKRATLVGDKTFGKGLVQTLETLKDGSAVKITVAKYFTPQGRDINKVGIAPDVAVPLTEEQQQALVQTRSGATAADLQYTKALAELGKLVQAQPNPSLQRSGR